MFTDWLDRIRWKIKTVKKKSGILSMGRYSYGSPKIVYYGGEGKITVGNFCSIAENVTFLLSGEHKISCISTFPFIKLANKLNLNKSKISSVIYRGDVNIGHDVWIGYGATIMAGVNIGNGAVIGANALVTKDVEPYAIVAGLPAKRIRMRFSKKEVQHLQKIEWWNWSDKKLKDNISIILSNSPLKLSYE